MLKSGAPMLLIPLQDRVKAEIIFYLKANQEEVSASQAAMLERYAENEEIRVVMVNSFFAEWEETGRRIRLEPWIRNAIAELLKVYS